MLQRLLVPLLTTCWLVMPAVSVSATPEVQPGQQVQVLSQRAEEALRHGEWQLGESLYRETLLEGYLLRGLLLAADGELDAAAAALERSTRAAFPLRRPLMALAQIEIRRGRAAEVLFGLRRLVTRSPDEDGELRRLLAQALVAAGLAEEAIQELSEIVAAHPQDLESVFALATGELSLGRVDAAEAHLGRILAASRPQDAAAAHVLVGRTWRDYGEYPRARAVLEKALQLDPKTRRAHFYLGTVELLAEGKAGITAALEHFDHELRLRPDDPTVHLYRGLALAEERRFAEAAPSLEIAATLPSLAADALHFLGRCQADAGDLPAAIRSYQEALVRLDPNLADPQQLTSLHFLLGNTLRQLGREDEAAGHFETARLESTRYTDRSRERLARYLDDSAAQEPAPFLAPLDLGGLENLPAEHRRELRHQVDRALARAHQNLGVLAARGGRGSRALDHLLDAAELVPTIPGLQRALGIAALQAGRRELARRSLTLAQAEAPADREVARLLALVLLEAGEPAKAATLLADDPDVEKDPALLYSLALARVRAGQKLEAERIFARLEKSHHDWAPYAVLLGQAEADQGNFAAAERELERALELDPQVADALATRGEMRLRQGRLAEAEQDLRAELAKSPGHSRARLQLATTLELAGKPEAARRELAALLAREPENADALYLLGKVLLAQGDAAGAAQRLEAAARLHPADAGVRYQWALALQRSGKAAAAAEQFALYRQFKAEEREVPP